LSGWFGDVGGEMRSLNCQNDDFLVCDGRRGGTPFDGPLSGTAAFMLVVLNELYGLRAREERVERRGEPCGSQSSL
jgi:hypothetical protein